MNMKRNVFFFFFLAGAVFRVFSQSPDQKPGKIRELTGEVELKHAGSAVFARAVAGDELTMNTIISTGFKSTAVIQAGSSTITMRPLTRLSLTELRASLSAEKLNVKLQTGRVKVDVKPSAGTKANVTVQGPGATASAQEASFEFDGFNLFVNGGAVSHKGGNGIVLLFLKNEESSTTREGGVSNPYARYTNELTSPFPADNIVIQTR
jgi:hypothetical protein